LGPHPHPGGGVVVRTFHPGARSVHIVHDGEEVRSEWVHGDGIQEALFPKATLPFRYRVRVVEPDGERLEDDAYRFPPVLAPDDLRAFLDGTDFRAFDRLGARPMRLDGVDGVHFAVWAPGAERVSVIGTFNAWSGRTHGMRAVGRTGVWEIFVPGVQPGDAYKYEIRTTLGGRRIGKADPFGTASELRPGTASIVADRGGYGWKDRDWMRSRAKRQGPGQPLSVYEVHLGSWKRGEELMAEATDEGAPLRRWLDWDEITASLVPYAKDLGFTHLELLPVTEHPFDGSWGYQTTGYFAATARFGPPDGMRRLVDAAHAAGLGVLLDWVPAHFPRDAHGLGFFDGTHLFEHADPRRGVHPDWETFVFDWSRPPVRSFLVSSALWWLEEFHVDGLRVDAVASMLYLDYSRKEGEWIPNARGGRENWDAVEFLRTLNDAVHEATPGALTMAEESTSWPAVTQATAEGGLGFDRKWNMGWMNDTLRFFRNPPSVRSPLRERLTFGLTYAFGERHLLPLSHDEVVHGKGSLLGKMPGERTERFAQLRTLLGLQWAHPGQKLLFMGGELAPWSEWNHDTELEWDLLQYPEHRGVQSWVRALNGLYRERAAFHADDDSWNGFEWITFDDPARVGIAFLRKAGKDVALVAANFSDRDWDGWPLGVPVGGTWNVVLDSEEERFGGGGARPSSVVAAEETRQGQPFSIRLKAPASSLAILVPASAGRAGAETEAKAEAKPRANARAKPKAEAKAKAKGKAKAKAKSKAKAKAKPKRQADA
jgi:1,4-alpha-glucan branching enzyme